MKCKRVRERDLIFESHMSGFVYKVRVDDAVLIKKEIPGPDTVDEFLYEINALSRLSAAKNVIRFYGVVVDDDDKYVKGLLISFAEQGALIDIIYDHDHALPWATRERWAHQIVTGLSEIHEAGFVQGDFTLSNIVIDDHGDAKIIDINRRGCPVGWEPPEVKALIDSNQRISMYIGVKSDLYQLGMVLWALATQEDEPEVHGRPLRISPGLSVPGWYRRIVDICLSEDPQYRMQALHLLPLFPEPELDSSFGRGGLPSIAVDHGRPTGEYFAERPSASSRDPQVRTVQPQNDWSYLTWGYTYPPPTGNPADDPYSWPSRGRSPPSPLPSNYRGWEPGLERVRPTWSDHYNDEMTAPSVSDVRLGDDELDDDHQKTPEAETRSATPSGAGELPSDAGIDQPPKPAEEREREVGDGSDQTGSNDPPPPSELSTPVPADLADETTQEWGPESPEGLESVQQENKAVQRTADDRSDAADHEHIDHTEQEEHMVPPPDAEHVAYEEDHVVSVGQETKGPLTPGEQTEDITGDTADMAVAFEVLEIRTAAAEVPDAKSLEEVDEGPAAMAITATDPIDLSPKDPDATPILGATELTKPPSAHEMESPEETSTTLSPPAAPEGNDLAFSLMHPGELTGIGSVHELDPSQRQEIIEEEDFIVSTNTAETTLEATTTGNAAAETAAEATEAAAEAAAAAEAPMTDDVQE